MKAALAGFAALVFFALVSVSVWATGHIAIGPAISELLNQPGAGTNPWFWATLFDAYFGFAWFWLYVAWREASAPRAALWLVLIALAGNMAMAAYVLIALAQTRHSDKISSLFIPRKRE